MKKKYSIALLFVGVVLICPSVILTISAASKKNIIGGADWPTFSLVFFSEYRGLYCYLALFGVLLVVASAVLSKIKKNG